MNYIHFFTLVMSFLVLGQCPAAVKTFHGASDASAVVFLDEKHFVIADDETNMLRIYTVENTQGPFSLLDLNAFLKTEADHPELDIEAAARVDDRIYWITSHGRNSDGKPRPNRYRFFCTETRYTENLPGLAPVGQDCSSLISQFLAQRSPVQAFLKEATRLNESLSKKQRQKLAPKEKGLNIEGLVNYPPHQSLLIGLRNPLYSSTRKAIVIELLNPQAVIDNRADAQFGRVVFWDLDNRGIRGMEYSPRHHVFFILAGATDSETTFVLYRWDGDFTHQPEPVYRWPEASTLNPEGIAACGDDDLLWVVSDDGTLEIPVESADQCEEGELLENGACPNKYLMNPARKTFRMLQIDPNNVSGQ